MSSSPLPHASLATRTSGRSSLFSEIWNNRSILWLLTRRELKARYAGSMLGVMWNVIHPIVMIAIFIVILGTIMGGKMGGEAGRGSYAIYLCAGMIPWLVFREIVTRCSVTILENAGLIKKVAFPEVILHLGVLINTLIIHSISYTAFILLLAAFGAWPGSAVFACYLILILASLFALGLGLIVSVLNIYFRDVGQLVEIILQFLFWFTPIVYFPSLLHNSSAPVARLAGRLLEWNPLVHFVRLSQWLFGSSEAFFSLASLLVVLGAPIASLIIGFSLFNSFKHDLLDNI